ncbi:hypothetical protein ACE04B_38450, partial [Rhizobium phaseoli]
LVRRIDKHFVCHVSCAPRRGRESAFPTAVETERMRSTVAAPDNESRAWREEESSSQTAAGTVSVRGLYTSDKTCCETINNQA